MQGLDSFAAFEEILGLARQHKVDMVLLSGDLFHQNKPSRNTMLLFPIIVTNVGMEAMDARCIKTIRLQCYSFIYCFSRSYQYNHPPKDHGNPTSVLYVDNNLLIMLKKI
jgi:hypothetical protein